MIPDLPHLSNPTLPADFLSPLNRDKIPLVDYARGGIALLDSSRGLNVKTWVCECQNDGVYISADGVQPFLVEILQGKLDWISFCFDQNMHYNLVYVIGGVAYMYWYDTEQQRYVTDNLGNITTPFLRMDDVIDPAIGFNDMVLSYIRNGALCCRIQVDRFKIEYLLASNAGSSIIQCGMNKVRRFQWNCV